MKIPRYLFVLTVFLLVFAQTYLIGTGLILYRVGCITASQAISVSQAALWPSTLGAFLIALISHIDSRRRNQRN